MAATLAEHLPADDGRTCLVCRRSITPAPCPGIPRPTCRPMLGGKTGSDPIAPEAWRVDLAEPDGHTVYGYLAPELEDVPPCCTADDARGIR